MRLVLLILALAACEETNDFPRVPGGGGGGGGAGGGGGGISDGGSDAPLSLIGNVCLVDDLRRLDQCATTGAGDLTVTLGTQTAITEDDGSFAMTDPVGSTLTWRVSGADIVTTVMGFSLATTIPVIGIDDYQTLLDGNGFLLAPGQGSLVVQTFDDTTPLPDALVASNPAGQLATRYDGTSSLVWDTDATGTFGMAWIAGIPAGAATITVTPPIAVGPAQSAAVAVEDGGITFAAFEL